MLHFDKKEFHGRLDQLITRMRENDLDGLLLFAQESMFWLTGYDTFGYCFFQCLVVRNDGEMVLLTRSADLRQAQHTSILENIEIWVDDGAANPVIRLKEVLVGLDLKNARLGVEYHTHGLTAGNGKLLDAGLAGFAALQEASDIVHELRLVKSDAELDYTRKSAELSDLAFDAALEIAAPGVFEGDIYAAMHRANYAGGGDYPGNEFILGSGRDALLCRNKSGRRWLSKQDQLTLEWSGSHARYHAAMMQTIVIGKPTPRHVELFEAAREALLAVQDTMRSGNSFGDLYAAHASVLDAAGLSAHRLNACGYSLGARYAPSWMDGPMFFKNNAQPIMPRMVLFAHMIIMDSDSDTAMTLGRSFVTADGKPEPLSRHDLDLIAV